MIMLAGAVSFLTRADENAQGLGILRRGGRERQRQGQKREKLLHKVRVQNSS
jgi:hypothetical protein